MRFCIYRRILHRFPDLQLGERDGRTARLWTQSTVTESNISYTNNERQGWNYDNEGRLTGDDNAAYGYNAAGRQNAFVSTHYVDVSPTQSVPALEVAQEFDGGWKLSPFHDRLKSSDTQRIAPRAHPNPLLQIL